MCHRKMAFWSRPSPVQNWGLCACRPHRPLFRSPLLVDLLDSGAARAARRSAAAAKAAAWHAALGHAAAAARRLVDLHHDGVHHPHEFLLLALELVLLGELVLVEPVQGILHR